MEECITPSSSCASTVTTTPKASDPTATHTTDKFIKSLCVGLGRIARRAIEIGVVGIEEMLRILRDLGIVWASRQVPQEVKHASYAH